MSEDDAGTFVELPVTEHIRSQGITGRRFDWGAVHVVGGDGLL